MKYYFESYVPSRTVELGAFLKTWGLHMLPPEPQESLDKLKLTH